MASGRLNGKTLDVYARVSRLGDERMRSTDGQVADCEDRIEDEGGRVGERLVDPGRSAWNPRVKRKNWDTLMERLESGVVDGVIVFDLTRFSRQPIEGERLIAAAERGLIVLDSEGEYDLTTASGKKNFRDQMSAAAYQSDRTSATTRRGKRRKALAGESNHSHRPYGFEADGSTPREPEATELRSLVARLLAGESQDAMVVDLNRRGVLTSIGGEWSRTALKQVLTRPRNAGLVEYKGEIVGTVAIADYEPVIDRQIHDQVMALYMSRSRGRNASDTYLMSGLIHCGLCKRPLYGRPRYNMLPYDDGSMRRQYACMVRADKYSGCGRIAGDWQAINVTCKALVLRILSDPKHAAAIEAAATQNASRLRDIETAIAELEGTAEELAARLGRGDMPLARYDAAVGPLDRRLAELQRQREQLVAAPHMDATDVERAATRAEWEERWVAATVPGRRTLVRRALRGRRLVLLPATPGLPRVFDTERIQFDD